MDKKVEISKIKIKIGKKEVSLSLDELKELKDVLDEILEKEKELVYVPSYPYNSQPYIYVQPNPYKVTPMWIPCGSVSGTMILDNTMGNISYTLTATN